MAKPLPTPAEAKAAYSAEVLRVSGADIEEPARVTAARAALTTVLLGGVHTPSDRRRFVRLG